MKPWKGSEDERKWEKIVITVHSVGNNWIQPPPTIYLKISHFISNCSSRCVSVTRLRNSLTVSQRMRTEAKTTWKSSVSIIDCVSQRNAGRKEKRREWWGFGSRVIVIDIILLSDAQLRKLRMKTDFCPKFYLQMPHGTVLKLRQYSIRRVCNWQSTTKWNASLKYHDAPSVQHLRRRFLVTVQQLG